MGWLLENCKYVVLIAVVALMLAAIATFGWGAVKTASFILALVTGGNDTLAIVSLLDMMDTFLIGTVLYAISVAIVSAVLIAFNRLRVDNGSGKVDDKAGAGD